MIDQCLITLMSLQGLRGALNALLFRTGDQSRDFAVILATNRPADLDAAVIDRMDEAIEFALPGKQERKQILKMYVDSYIALAGTQEGALSIECPYLTNLSPSFIHARTPTKTLYFIIKQILWDKADSHSVQHSFVHQQIMRRIYFGNSNTSPLREGGLHESLDPLHPCRRDDILPMQLPTTVSVDAM